VHVILRRIGLAALLLTAVVAADSKDPQVELAQLAKAQRSVLAYDGGKFSGPAWQRLLDEGRRAQFFLIGEEHGIAENPRLVAQLFTALVPSGYRHMVIEISPPMASVVDEALQVGGLEGLRALYAQPGGEPAFFGMKEEAEMLAAVRAAVPPSEPAFWGADYEVAGDRALLRVLQASEKPPAAELALDKLVAASHAGWNKHAATGGPQHIFTFAGEPGLVRAVRSAWPNPDPESARILDTLEATLEINRLWRTGQPYESNRRRAALLRSNFLYDWQQYGDESLKLMFKFGASHMVRGRNNTQTYDLGTLLPEVTGLAGTETFSLLVVPGEGSLTAVLNPATWSFDPAPPKDGYLKGLDPLLAAALPDEFTLFDLRPLREKAFRRARHLDPALLRTLFGFDMLLVMSGSTAAAEFEHDQQ
jgi:hypothetical protein